MIDVARTKIKLSDNWKWARCGEVIDVRDGTHDTPKYVTSGYPLITSKNLRTEGIDFSNVSYISKEDHYEISKRSKVDRGDILFAMIGTIGNPVIVDVDSEFSIKNVALFKFSKSPIDAKYFKYLLETPIITEQLNSEQRGGTQKFVSLNVLRNIVIPYPPLEEQCRIAAILDKADAVRRKRQSAIALTEELLRSAFLEMFGDPVTNPKGWEIHQLEDFSAIQSGIAKGKKIEQSKAVSVPYMRVANVQDGYIDLSEIKELEVLLADVNKYTLQEGDLLLTEGGDPDKLGRGSVWYGEIQPCIHQNHIFCVRPDRALAEPEYLSALIGSERGKKYFLQAAKQTTGIATINKTQLRTFPALLPPLYLQQKYTEFVKLIRSTRKHLINKHEQVDNLFNSLLQKAFRGEL